MTKQRKLQAAEQLRRALQMFVATLDDEKAVEVACVYDAWKVGKFYEIGERFTYGENGVGDPQLYKVNQAHTSQADWLPDATAALYSPVGVAQSGYDEWSQPTGAHDAYNIGDIVDYNGTLYISNMNGNVFAPNSGYGWELYNQ